MHARLLMVGFVFLAGCSSSSGSAGGQTPSGAGSTSPEGGITSPDEGATSPDGGAAALNPDTAPVVAVDRFSDSFAHLFARSKNASLPAPNAPIDFDKGEPFVTHGLGPAGQKITYYNFDVLSVAPAPIYVLFRQGDTMPVDGQLNVIEQIPGDPGYNDFWNVIKVTVPANYVANTLTSVDDIVKSGYPLSPTKMLVNCPVVPDGSTAKLRYTSEPAGLIRGWYKHMVVKYFTFGEHALTADDKGTVPLSDIYVSFNVNPDPNNPASGPPSGFMTEAGTAQTHNVTETLPEDPGYSPLWDVNVYDHAAFANVSSLTTVMQANVLATSVARVNCPIVSKQ